MFGWLKRLTAKAKAAPPPPAAKPEREGKQTTVMEVVDRFLVANPGRTPWGVHALIAAGGARLRDADEVLQACRKIEKHGYQYPLNPTLSGELEKHEILEFLRWQADGDVDREEYANDMRIRGLIERFREQRRG